jgi:hypothetical protein
MERARIGCGVGGEELRAREEQKTRGAAACGTETPNTNVARAHDHCALAEPMPKRHEFGVAASGS